jgi:hypothetical protein
VDFLNKFHHCLLHLLNRLICATDAPAAPNQPSKNNTHPKAQLEYSPELCRGYVVDFLKMPALSPEVTFF